MPMALHLFVSIVWTVIHSKTCCNYGKNLGVSETLRKEVPEKSVGEVSQREHLNHAEYINAKRCTQFSQLLFESWGELQSPTNQH